MQATVISERKPDFFAVLSEHTEVEESIQGKVKVSLLSRLRDCFYYLQNHYRILQHARFLSVNRTRVDKGYFSAQQHILLSKIGSLQRLSQEASIRINR